MILFSSPTSRRFRERGISLSSSEPATRRLYLRRKTTWYHSRFRTRRQIQTYSSRISASRILVPVSVRTTKKRTHHQETTATQCFSINGKNPTHSSRGRNIRGRSRGIHTSSPSISTILKSLMTRTTSRWCRSKTDSWDSDRLNFRSSRTEAETEAKQRLVEGQKRSQ